MKTKNMKTTKMTTMMMITAATLIGTIGIGTQSAFADTIDFENFDEADLVGSVPTSTNSVTIEIDDGFTGRPGTVVEADSGDQFGFGVGGNPDDAQNGWNVNNAKSLSNNACCAEFPAWDSFDYVLTFDHVVSSVSIDLYDYEVNGLAVLEIFDGLGALISTISLPDAGDGDTITLADSSSDPLIKSARISTTSIDVGTAIDNIEFTTALVKTSNCTDTETDDPIEVLIKKHTHPVECSFTIEFNGEADETLSIHDTVPAEWEVTNEEDLDNIDCEVETKKAGKSATHIWCPSESAPITVEVETRESPGKGHTKNGGDQAFKPTFCGILTLNDGAILHDDDDPPNVLATSGPLLLLVSEDGDDSMDCDGDGLTDAEEFALGTDPNDTDTDNDTLSDYDEVNIYNSDPTTANTILVNSSLDSSMGGENTFGHHTSTGNPYGTGGTCDAFSGSAFVLDNGYVNVIATALLRDSDCDVPTGFHDTVQLSLHCDEGDEGAVGVIPLSTEGGAATEGSFDHTNSFGSLGTCSNATVFVESTFNTKWLAKSP